LREKNASKGTCEIYLQIHIYGERKRDANLGTEVQRKREQEAK